MPSTERTAPRAHERSARNPWSTEPELPPDGERSDFDTRTALLTLRGETKALIEELGTELDELRPQLVVQTGAEAEYVAAVRRLAAAEQTALDVHAALTRLNEGVYGFCAACTGPIPPARLRLRPHTRCCVSCS